MPDAPDELVIELYDVFVEKFALTELNDFAFELSMNPDMFESSNLSGRARELATFLMRRDLLPKLLAVGQQRRADIDWEAMLRRYSAASLLEVGDQERLAIIVAGLGDMALGPAARLSFLRRAHLGSIAPRFELAQPPATLAPQLIDLLQTMTPLPVQPNYEPLGLLLVELLNDSEMARDDKRFVAELLVKYSLIADLDKLDELRQTYIVDSPTVRSADASNLAPRKQPITATPIQTRGASEPGQLDVVSGKTEKGDFLDVEWLAGAIYAGQAVGRIEQPEGTPSGTGFLVGPNLVLTCHYVLKNPSALDKCVIRFGYSANSDGVVRAGRVFTFDPGFFETSSALELNFTLVRINDEPLADKGIRPEDEGLGYLELLQRGRHRGYLLLSPARMAEQDPVAIIQHANGEPLKVTIDNYVVSTAFDDRIHYLGDTMPGSAGAPVLDRNWQVVALHYAGGVHPPRQLDEDSLLGKLAKGPQASRRLKEGVPIRAILPFIERYLPRT